MIGNKRLLNKNMMMNKTLTTGVMLSLSIASIFAAESGKPVTFYVSPDGNDAFAGTTMEQPVASLAKARDLVRPHAGKNTVSVNVADGVYYLPETLSFSSVDSGTAEHPITYRADNEGGAVLSGGSKLDLKWITYKDGICQAKTPEGLEIDQLFIDGKAQRMARYPNYDPKKKTAAYQGYSADAFSKERAANWADPAGGYIHAMHVQRWGGYHYRITGKDAKGEVTYEGGWQNNRQMGMHKDFRMVENIFEELDAPGEWFHNAKTSTLYYMPAEGVSMDSSKVEVVRLRHLIELQGTQEAPVKFITLKGFTVRHAARTFMDCKEPLLRSDWAIYRGGAFLLTGTEDVSILDCEFDQVGGNAVFVNNYNRRVKVAGCHIHDAGASGVCFVGDPKAVRNPLFEYNEENHLSEIDLTPGPKTDNYPADSIVEDCLIHGIGKVEKQPAGVQISMAQGITVRDLSIYDCARSGINVSEGTWGGHLIEGCDVFDTVLETHDHGSFNSWGRDRFWHLKGAESSELPKLAQLDAIKTSIIRNSRWRCDHGWDVDLDDGSSNYDIYNNLMLAKGLKLREGFRRHAWNNIIVNNGLHPHVWYLENKDQVYGNILMGQHRPARIKRPNADDANVDKNFYFVGDESAVKVTSEKLGWDKNSVFGDPQFVDPASGDFRVKDGSPALKIGFKNFPMDQFGVKKPSLKKIARTPQIPTPVLKKATNNRRSANIARRAKRASQSSVWLGAKLQALSGEEFSAYGVSKDDGGIVLNNVPKDSVAAQQGLKEGDVVQQVNGKAVRTSDELLKACAKAGNTALKLKVVRDQQAKEIVIVLHARGPKNGFGIVPMPFEAKALAGNPFMITKETILVGQSAEAKKCAAYLAQRLTQSCGISLKTEASASGKAIVLTVSDDATAFSENDAYRLESSADKITIAAKTERGLFYGVQSLLQLLPPAIYGDKVQAGLELKVPAVSINDKPSIDRMRGLHVDISRHFRTKEELLKIIDSMAMHKLNTLHLHATDQQGWRIEIKAYPKLTTIGAIGNKTDAAAPATFLTQQEVKEIVAYANSRYVSIFPEIDMPGHMGAAIRAYPELNHPKDIHDKKYALRGDAPARKFCKTVLTEINDLFDSDFIHIGFDEVNYGAKTELYTDAELIDFVTDITTFVKEDLKKTPIVWDDIFMHGFEDKESVVQWWRYGKKYWWKRMQHTVDEKLNTKQQPFILSPAYWTYFDMKNLKGGWAKPLSVAQVYNWDPFGDMLGKTEHTRKLAIGAVACTWSEQIPTMKVFGDRTYPRLASFSERIWRGGKEEAPNILSWADYRDQVLIPFQLKRYDALGLHYWSKDKPELLLDLPDNRKLLDAPAAPKNPKKL